MHLILFEIQAPAIFLWWVECASIYGRALKKSCDPPMASTLMSIEQRFQTTELYHFIRKTLLISLLFGTLLKVRSESYWLNVGHVCHGQLAKNVIHTTFYKATYWDPSFNSEIYVITALNQKRCGQRPLIWVKFSNNKAAILELYAPGKVLNIGGPLAVRFHQQTLYDYKCLLPYLNLRFSRHVPQPKTQASILYAYV